MADKILYIIRGVPGSGKSTLAHKLSPIVVEADDFMMVDGEYKYDPKKVHYCHKKCFETVENHLKNGEPIVAVANTFIKKSLYAPYVDLANEYGYKVIIRKTDGNYQNIHNVPADVVNTMRKRFQECMNEVTENDDKNYYMDAMVGNDSLSMAKLLSNGNEHTGLLRETLKKVSDESYVMEITSYNDIKPFIKRYCSFGARGVLNTNNNKVYLADSMALTHGDMVDDLIKNGEQIDYDSIIRFMVYPTYETAIDSEYGEYWNNNEDNRIDFLTNKDLYVLFKQYSFMNDRLNKILKLDTMEDVEKNEYLNESFDGDLIYDFDESKLNENVVYRGYDKKYGVITHPDWIYVTEDLEQARYYASKDGSVKNGGVIEYDIDDNLYFLTLDEVNEYMSEYDEEYTLNDLLWYQQGLSDYLINYGDGIKFQDPYFSNHTVYILFDTDYLKNGKEINLNESIAYAEMNDDDMMVILHNPTRKELQDNGMIECRIVKDWNDNFYFANSYEMIHTDIVDKLESENITSVETNLFYDTNSNTFYYNVGHLTDDEIEKYSEREEKYLRQSIYISKTFKDFHFKIIFGEL